MVVVSTGLLPGGRIVVVATPVQPCSGVRAILAKALGRFGEGRKSLVQMAPSLSQPDPLGHGDDTGSLFVCPPGVGLANLAPRGPERPPRDEVKFL